MGNLPDASWLQLSDFLRDGETRRTETPVCDFGFIDLVAVVIRRREAWSRADRAVDVDDSLAGSADQMVVVIVHPILVASRRPHGLNASQEPVLD